MDRPVRGSALRGISGTIMPGRMPASGLEPGPQRLGAVELHQHAAQVVVEGDGASLVVSTPAAMPDSIWPSAILLATRTPSPGRCRTPAGRRRRGSSGPAGAQHGLAGEVAVAAVLEHGARDDLAEPLALQPEAGGEPVERGGEHVLVGRLRVGALERANGMRLPPITAAFRVAGLFVAIGTSEVGRVAGTHSIRYCLSRESRGGETLQDARRTRSPMLRGRASRAVGCRDRRDSRWDAHRPPAARSWSTPRSPRSREHGAGVGMDEIAATAGHQQDRRLPALRRPGRAARRRLHPGGRPAAAPAARGDGPGSARPREMLAAAIDDLPGAHRARPGAVPVRRPPAGDATGAAGADPIGTLSRPGRRAGRGRHRRRARRRPARDPAAAAAVGPRRRRHGPRGCRLVAVGASAP